MRGLLLHDALHPCSQASRWQLLVGYFIKELGVMHIASGRCERDILKVTGPCGRTVKRFIPPIPLDSGPARETGLWEAPPRA